MPQAADRWTAEMVRELPDDGNRYEVMDGELFVTPSPAPRHQRAIATLLPALSGYVRSSGLGEVLTSPADISFAEDMLVQPDVLVVPLMPDGRRIRHWTDIGVLLLVVEVLSPSSARADRQVKRRLYQRHRTGEYWIVDLDARVVERWRPGDERPEILADRLTWLPDGAGEPFVLDLTAWFAEVLDR